MRYNLANGKTITITFDQWLSLSNNDIEAFMAADSGSYFDDPFTDFDAIEHKDKPKIESEIPQVEEIPEEEIEQIKKELQNED